MVLTKAAPAMLISTERGTWNWNETAIEERMARMGADGVREFASFTFDPSPACHWSAHYNVELCHCTRVWLRIVRQWLAGAL